MDNPITPNEQKTLGDRLRHEASQSRPAFSESLHDRILHAVEQCEMAEPLRPRAEPRWSQQSIAVAAAALLVVSTLALLWQGNHSSVLMDEPSVMAGHTEPENVIVATDITTNPAVDIGLLVDSTVTDWRWAYLDHDAQLAASLLLDQLSSSIAWSEENP